MTHTCRFRAVACGILADLTPGSSQDSVRLTFWAGDEARSVVKSGAPFVVWYGGDVGHGEVLEPERTADGAVLAVSTPGMTERAWQVQTGHDVRMDEAIPVLGVNDADTSVAWYSRLGYEKEWEHRFEPSLPAFVSIARAGGARLFLSEHERDASGPLVAGTVVYLRVSDIDEIATQFDAEVIDRPWAREVHLTDPDGNRLRIGAPTM